MPKWMTMPESRRLLKESIIRVCEGISEASDAKIEAEFLGDGVSSTNNDENLYEFVRGILKEDAVIMNMPSSGSEDFALYQEKIPGILIRLGTNNDNDPASKYSLHNPKIHFEEEAMLYALELFKQIIEGNY